MFFVGKKKKYAVGHLQIVTIAYGEYYFYFRFYSVRSLVLAMN